MPINRVMIDWKQSMIVLDTGGEKAYVYDHRHFESLYDCLCLALSMGYLVTKRTREAVELVFDPERILSILK